METDFPTTIDPAAFETNAIAVADVLRAIANERRLQILCVLMEGKEANVGTLVSRIGISQSALSQHLAKMRDEGCSPSAARARRSGTASRMTVSAN